ncbi:MAG TPA: hypothetical protein VGO93_26355 [Candidatus Xenobia bacterium]
MEPVLRNFIFCDAIVPLPEGKIACYGIFTDLFVAAFPVTYPRFCIMTSWTQAPGFHIQQIKMLNPARTAIIQQSPEQYFTLSNETETANVITELNQLMFSEAGAYVFQLLVDSRLAGEFPLYFRAR